MQPPQNTFENTFFLNFIALVILFTFHCYAAVCLFFSVHALRGGFLAQ